RGLRARLERWRERLAGAMAAAVPPPEGAVLRALIVGDEEGIDADLREAFTRAGVVHVLSISGLHVGLVAAAGFALARRLLGRSERLLLAVDVERLAALLSLGPVALYAALAGLGVATLRSAIMVAAAVLAGLLGRRADVLRTLALAALVLALAWPGTAAGRFRTAGLVLWPGIALVRTLAKPAWAAVDVPIPSVLELALVYGLLAALLWLPRRGARALALVALAGLAADAAWWGNERCSAARLRVTFLDVGQGDAAVLELPGG